VSKRRELRVPLPEIAQEEDPMALSLGVTDGGGTLRFELPFRF
jgi:hypothetical protein